MKKSAIFLIFFISAFLVKGAVDSSPVWVRDRMKLDIKPLNSKSEAMYIYNSKQISKSGAFIIIHNRILVKILKSTGLNYGSISVFSNERSSVDGIKGWRFSEKGVFLEELEDENINRRAYNLDFHDDSTQVFANFKNVEKGDFVAFQYTERLNLFFNDLMFPMGSSVDIIRQEITVSGTPDVKVLNDEQNIVVSENNTFYIENIPQIDTDGYSPVFRDRIPLLAVSFDRAKYSTWSEFASSYWEQTKHALDMNDDTKNQLGHLFSQTDKKAFIKNTLNHVSSGINYIDIEFGKGGYIPSTCNFVHEKKYGDCKDMAYYAAAILKRGGIKAYPVLAKSRSYGKVYKEFVSDQFNHVILAVELDNETTEFENLNVAGIPYLIADLTDRFTEIPGINPSLEDSNLLIVKEGGGQMVSLDSTEGATHLKSYNLEMTYMFNRDLNVKLREDMHGKYAVSERVRRENITSDKEKDIYNAWIQSIIPGAGLKNYTVVEELDSVVTTVELFTRNYGIVSDGNIYFIPNIIDSGSNSFRKRIRETDIQLNAKTSRRIKMDVTLSSLLTILEEPSSYESDNRFFKGTFSVKKVGDRYILEKYFVWKVKEIKKEDYKELRKEYRTFMKAVKSPFILRNNS